jgi:hypothetical protein
LGHFSERMATVTPRPYAGRLSLASQRGLEQAVPPSKVLGVVQDRLPTLRGLIQSGRVAKRAATVDQRIGHRMRRRCKLADRMAAKPGREIAASREMPKGSGQTADPPGRRRETAGQEPTGSHVLRQERDQERAGPCPVAALRESSCPNRGREDMSTCVPVCALSSFQIACADLLSTSGAFFSRRLQP